MINNQQLGIWITKDGKVETPDRSNLYRYTGNDPTNFTDPSGLAAIGALCTAVKTASAPLAPEKPQVQGECSITNVTLLTTKDDLKIIPLFTIGTPT